MGQSISTNNKERIKLEYLGEIRKIAEVPKFEMFVELAREKFEEIRDFHISTLRFEYDDIDCGETFTISNDNDLHEAYESAAASSGKQLKIVISHRDTSESSYYREPNLNEVKR